MSFGGNIHEVGFNAETQQHEAVLKLEKLTVTLSGISAEMAKEFAYNLYQDCYFSITVKP